MSVLIKGMKMPESCRDCGMEHGMEQEGFWCGVIREYSDTTCFDSERRENCPLIEIPPHGRLIDADALICTMIETLESLKKNPKMDKEEAHLIAAFHTLGEMVKDMPTIIEAEVEE